MNTRTYFLSRIFDGFCTTLQNRNRGTGYVDLLVLARLLVARPSTGYSLRALVKDSVDTTQNIAIYHHKSHCKETDPAPLRSPMGANRTDLPSYDKPEGSLLVTEYNVANNAFAGIMASFTVLVC